MPLAEKLFVPKKRKTGESALNNFTITYRVIRILEKIMYCDEMVKCLLRNKTANT